MARGKTISKALLAFACTSFVIFWTSSFRKTSPILDLEITPIVFSNEYLKILEQNDSRITKVIRTNYLRLPKGDYNFDKYPKRDGVDPIAPYVAELFKHKRNGFYIEAGSNDGEFLSNTLTLEMEYGWTGLLIEADPQPFKELVKRNRKAWIANVCLAIQSYPHQVKMERVKNWSPMSKILKNTESKPSYSESTTFTAQCFPLFSILSALNVTIVDYFGMDLEDVELEVLETFPFDQGIIIKVISAEVHGSTKPLIKFLESRGYKVVNFIKADWTSDLVFVHRKSFPTLPDVNISLFNITH